MASYSEVVKGAYIFALLFCGMLGSCTSSPQKSRRLRDQQSYADFRKSIFVGETDTLSVMSLLGPPHLVSKNDRAQEVWSYKHKVFAADSKAYDLIFVFNSSNVLKDYTILSSEY